VQQIFGGCYELISLDIRKFDTTNITNFFNAFSGVQTRVEITTNVATKTWLNENFPSYTNIVVVPTT